MAPRRRSTQSGSTRMDAAIDAMLPYGFTKRLVRKTVKELLKVYGGNDGYPFIEDSGYALLIDTLLANQNEEPPEEGHFIEDSKRDVNGNEVLALPCGYGLSNENALVDGSNSEAPQTETLTNTSGFYHSLQPAEDLLVLGASKNNLPPGDGSSNDNTLVAYSKSEGPKIETATNNYGSNHSPQPVEDFLLCETGGNNLSISPPPGFGTTCSPSPSTSSLPVRSSPHKRGRPWHGWICSDDEEELVELKPTPLCEELQQLLNVNIKLEY